MQIGVSQPRMRMLFERLLTCALEAVDPFEAVLRTVKRRGSRLQVGERRYDLSRYKRIVVVGAGKASARMASALEERLETHLSGGLIVVKYEHGAPTKRIEIVEAGHPVPDAAGEHATTRILA